MSLHFDYYNPTTICFGEGKIAQIPKYIGKEQKVLVVYGGGSIKNNGVYDQVARALEGYEWSEFGGVEPNPTYETMNKAVQLVRDENISYVLAVGGGSVVDGCKYLIAASLYDGDGWDFLDGSAQVQKALPLGVVLTLPATGSESNTGAVITKKQTDEKRFFHSPFSFPQFAVLDPKTMDTLSDRQLANGLVDAFVHTCEQYLTKPNDSFVHEGYSETILRGLVSLASDWESRKSLRWQENLMLLANQALNGFIGSGVAQDWASHMIGHELTAFYGIDHAKTLAIVQPPLLRVMQEKKSQKLLQMGKNVFGKECTQEETIEMIEKLYESVGISTNLNDYDIDEKVIENVLRGLESHGMTALGEDGVITLEVSKQILEMAHK
ncbi:MAG: iron-containing alcohol dehydrogenase [Campylobacterota bacterium]